jgi:hypothetical protein
MTKTDDWIPFEDLDGNLYPLCYRQEGETIFLRQPGRKDGSIALDNFRAIINQVDQPCFICRPGILEKMDFTDLSFPKLVCNACKARYCCVLGELRLCNPQEAYVQAKRRGIVMPSIRAPRARRRQIHYSEAPQ